MRHDSRSHRRRREEQFCRNLASIGEGESPSVRRSSFITLTLTSPGPTETDIISRSYSYAIQDCTIVLHYEPKNFKALYRRGIALARLKMFSNAVAGQSQPRASLL